MGMSPEPPQPSDDGARRGDVILITASHGFPPTQARFSRATELVLAMGERGVVVDVVVLLERPLEPPEEDALDLLRAAANELDLVRHPSSDALWGAARARLAGALGLGQGLGGFLHCPRRLISRLRSRHAPRGYRAAIVSGVQLAPALAAFPRWTDRLLDVQRLGSAAFASHRDCGRPDELDAFADPLQELRLLGRADLVLVSSQEDAVALRQEGHPGDLLLVPPLAPRPPSPAGAGSLAYEGPIRPPRILCVGSDTAANLDGLRWFRRLVFPAITRAVPTCRLRIVGEAARHIEPGPGVDRIGWVDRLDEELRDAAVVALPLRMGSGVRRRLVEALGHGKAVATTRVGAHGAGLVPGLDAIVADRPEELAFEIVRVLTSGEVRTGLERRARELAASRFGAGQSIDALCRWLGLLLPELELEAPLEAAPAAARVFTHSPQAAARA
jgi:glycosyltransferase involved in cell wall biosynthesis